MQFAGIERDLRVLLITSTDAGESKSTTAANLAVTLARSGSTVCLIDADLRNPRLHMFFGVQQKQGLSDVLLGQARPPEAIVSFAEIEGLGMMPVGRKAPNPAELLGSNRMSVLLGALKKRFDIVIVEAVRSPLGRRNGQLSTVHPAELLGHIQRGGSPTVLDRVMAYNHRRVSGRGNTDK